MITVSYLSMTAAIVAASAIGATGAAWVLCGTLVENRALVSRIRRFEGGHLRSQARESGAGGHSRPSALPEARRPRRVRPLSDRAALRHNRAEVRRALRCTERLLLASRRHHVGAHRLDAWTGPVPPRRPQQAHRPEILTHRVRPRLAIA